jgi:murein DD-endopeptidase / murein LD-carboxypeptidase
MAFNFSGSPTVMAAEVAAELPRTDSSSDLFAPVRQSASNLQNLFSGIKQYLGTRYRFGGESPSGFDCSGFVRFMFSKELDVQLPRSSQEMSAVGIRVERNELKPGDLVFFKNGKNHINHVGIFIGNDTFVHSSLSKGITRDTLNESYYNNRFAAAVRILDDQKDDLSRDIELLLETLPEEDSTS